MARRPSVCILTHQHQGLDEGYFLAAVARLWRQDGYRVLLQQGLRRPVEAELAILHVDLTRVPDDYAALARRYARTLNGGVTDISKRRVSGALLTESDDYEGPVIVKADLNHGGASERRLRRTLSGRWRASLTELVERLPAPWGAGPRNGDYWLFERRAQVPRWVWRDDALVVEPLFVEPHGSRFAINQWLFLGEAEIVSTLLGPSPLVKMASVTGSLPLHRDVPEEIRQRRRDLGFDYGKFDYVIHRGCARLLDANTTPHRGPDAAYAERVATCCRILADGLESLHAGSAP